MKTIAATFAMILVAGSALYAAADDTLAASIEKQGGHVVRDAKGNIVEVSLARTWATDADVEKLAGIKTLKKLDLSLTYVSDVGARGDWHAHAARRAEPVHGRVHHGCGGGVSARQYEPARAESAGHRRHRYEPGIHQPSSAISGRSTSASRRSAMSAWSTWRRSRNSRS